MTYSKWPMTTQQWFAVRPAISRTVHRIAKPMPVLCAATRTVLKSLSWLLPDSPNLDVASTDNQCRYRRCSIRELSPVKHEIVDVA